MGDIVILLWKIYFQSEKENSIRKKSWSFKRMIMKLETATQLSMDEVLERDCEIMMLFITQ